jgi:HD-GYP domain-containing protein (c-di-GMP phosphodiesterase class II)
MDKHYPDGLSGDEIPLGSRIILICDAYDAMTEPQPYGDVNSRADAIAEFRRCSGTQFDPDLVEVLIGQLETEECPLR